MARPLDMLRDQVWNILALAYIRWSRDEQALLSSLRVLTHRLVKDIESCLEY